MHPRTALSLSYALEWPWTGIESEPFEYEYKLSVQTVKEDDGGTARVKVWDFQLSGKVYLQLFMYNLNCYTDFFL